MTTAFVLWGGGSLGAAQVGMLRALAEYGIGADLVVGASVGALNAAYYAAHPDVEGVEELARLWLSVSGHDVYPMDRAQTLRSLAGDLPFHRGTATRIPVAITVASGGSYRRAAISACTFRMRPRTRRAYAGPHPGPPVRVHRR